MMRSSRLASSRLRRGVTLIELLVVVAIAVVLMAGAIPLLRSSVQDNKLREASRVFNVLFLNAQSLARERGRPAGVWIERATELSGGTPVNPNLANTAVQCYLAETPPPYAGDIEGARTFEFSDSTIGNSVRATNTVFIELYLAAMLKPPFVQKGDLIRFNNQGGWYLIRYISPVPVMRGTVSCWAIWFCHPDTQFTVGADNQPGVANVDDDQDGTKDNPGEIGWPNSDDRWNTPHLGPSLANQKQPFQILRQPRKLLSSVVEFPAGTAMDLRFSGIGLVGTEFAATNIGERSPVVVMFSPSGHVDRLIVHGESHAPAGGVHFLIGRVDGFIDAENLPVAPNTIQRRGRPTDLVTYDENLSSHSSIWVSVGNRTGAVSATENAWQLTPDPADGNRITFEASMIASREFASRFQSLGGQ